MNSVPATPISPIKKNMAYEITAAADAPPARETVMRVAAGAIAKKYLRQHLGIIIQGYLAQLGPITIEPLDWEAIETNPFFCPDNNKIPELENFIASLRKEGDSTGARINVQATNIPAGLGEPVFSRLDADLAHALMSINAVKGVEIGAGFNCINRRGSEFHDTILPTGFTSNTAGGVLGGISTGQTLTASIALKPTSSIPTAQDSINEEGQAIQIRTTGRHDPCVGIRATPIAEAMVAIVLMDHVLRDRAQNAQIKR